MKRRRQWGGRGASRDRKNLSARHLTRSHLPPLPPPPQTPPFPPPPRQADPARPDCTAAAELCAASPHAPGPRESPFCSWPAGARPRTHSRIPEGGGKPMIPEGEAERSTPPPTASARRRPPPPPTTPPLAQHRCSPCHRKPPTRTAVARPQPHPTCPGVSRATATRGAKPTGQRRRVYNWNRGAKPTGQRRRVYNWNRAGPRSAGAEVRAATA
eukprot:scaffold3566_cov119-Isochrysis_galbana.AAC.4